MADHGENEEIVTDSERPKPIKNPQVSRDEIVFAHPSEEELASILDFYGVAWQYEPTTFPLRWDKQGHVTEAFSPDFYLTDQLLYVELTTLERRLARVKRRKIRLMRELYPSVRIKLWNRRDFVRLLEHYGLSDQESALVGQAALDDKG